MPRQFTGQNPDQTIKFNIPQVGEVFTDKEKQGFYVMTEQGVKPLGQKDLLNLTADARTSPDAISKGQVLKQVLSQINEASLPSYNIGDIATALGKNWNAGSVSNIADIQPYIDQYKSGQFTGSDISKGYDIGYGQNVMPSGMSLQDALKQSQQIQQLAQQSNDPTLKKNAQILASLVGSSGGSSGNNQDALQKIQDTINQITQTIQKEGVTDASGKVLLPAGVGLQGATNATNATNDVRQQLIKMGIDPKMVASISDSQLPMIGIFTDYLKSQQTLGNSTAQANLDTWQQALNSAKNDPDIQTKYGDALKMAGRSFDDAVSNFQTNLNITAQQQGQQMTEQQKAQAEAAASAGQAFSGFRQQAKEKLAQTQGGVIESTRAQMKKQISDLGTGFESQFGSGAVKPLSYNYLNPLTGQQENFGYTPVGGITGTNPLSQKSDIFTKAKQTYDITKTP